MPNNRVIPQLNPFTGTPPAGFSIGPEATDTKAPPGPGTISALDTINVLSAAAGFPNIPLTSQNSLANIVSGYFKKYAVGPSLYTHGSDTSDISFGSLVNAQALFVTISAVKETYTRYHTAKDGKILVGFTRPETWQRSISDWVSTSPDTVLNPRVGSYTITVLGASSTVVNGNPYDATLGYVIAATGLRSGIYQITVKDNYSGFYLNTSIEVPYNTPNANIYQRCPYKQRLNNGSWTSNTSQGYS